MLRLKAIVVARGEILDILVEHARIVPVGVVRRDGTDSLFVGIGAASAAIGHARIAVAARPVVRCKIMVSGYEDKGYTGGLCQLGGAVEEGRVLTVVVVVALILVDVTGAEHDAGLGHEVGGF